MLKHRFKITPKSGSLSKCHLLLLKLICFTSPTDPLPLGNVYFEASSWSVLALWHPHFGIPPGEKCQRLGASRIHWEKHHLLHWFDVSAKPHSPNPSLLVVCANPALRKQLLYWTTIMVQPKNVKKMVPWQLLYQMLEKYKNYLDSLWKIQLLEQEKSSWETCETCTTRAGNKEDWWKRYLSSTWCSCFLIFIDNQTFKDFWDNFGGRASSFLKSRPSGSICIYIYIWIVLYGSERHSPLLKDMVLVVPHFWSGIHNFLDRPPLTRATCSGQRNMAQGCETAKLRHGFKASATSKCDLLVSEELYAFITWLFWNMIRIMQVSCIIIVTMVYDIW